MNFITSDFKQISTAAQLNKELVQMDPLVMDREGFVMVYVSNESDELNYVHFDDFTIYQGKTHVVYASNYTPFGMQFGEFERTASEPVRYKFQEQEHDTSTGWIAFKWRNYNRRYRRFFNIDPLAESYVHNSTYAFAENKVITFRELEGLEGVHFQEADGSHVIQKNVVVLQEPLREIPDGATDKERTKLEKKNNRITSRNEAQMASVQAEFASFYGNAQDSNGNSAQFQFNFIAMPDFDKSGMSQDQINDQYETIANQNGIDAVSSFTNPDTGETSNVLAPAAVLTRESATSGDFGDTHGNVIRVNTHSPSGTPAPAGTRAHEGIHTFGVPDNGYNRGGILNSPPQGINQREVDDVIKRSHKRKGK